jgi:glycerol uptake facilitator-like aquaporin
MQTLPTGAILAVLILVFRTGPGQWLAEAVATFGLLLIIFGCVSRRPDSVAYAVGLYITAAYLFTASTSFANPAVTIARSLSDTFADSARRGDGLHCVPARGNGRGSHPQSLALARANDRLGSNLRQ